MAAFAEPIPKSDDRDPVCSGIGHRFFFATDVRAVHLGEHVHVIAKIDQQDILTEFFERCAGVSRQPVGDDFFFCFHIASHI